MRVELLNFRGMGTGSSPSLLSEWRVGAIVQAVAVRDSTQQQLWLEIGAQRHPARIASGDLAGPRHGETLQLRVLRNSPVLALETLSSSASASSETDFMTDALRKYVPRQESPALLLANLAWLAQGKGGTQGLPRDVMAAAAGLWQALPDTAKLGDPAGLRDALVRSGVFLEAHLAAGANAALRSDLKALLLSLGRSLQLQGARASAAGPGIAHSPLPASGGPLTPLPAAPASLALLDAPASQLNELARHTEGALARLMTTQIANHASDTPQPILVELPVRHEERAYMLRLRIEPDGAPALPAHERPGETDERSGRPGDESPGEYAAQAWSVEAALDLGTAGGLHAKVTLDGQRIGVQLRAESPAIVEALSARAGELESALREAGLDIDRIMCLHGLPAGDPRARTVRLLDVKA